MLWASSFHLLEQSGAFWPFELLHLSQPALGALSALHTLVRWTSVQLSALAHSLWGWCWRALGLDLFGMRWTVKSGYILVGLPECTVHSPLWWSWHCLADIPGPVVIRGLQLWPLQPNHPDEDIWPQKESPMNLADLCPRKKQGGQLLIDDWVIWGQVLGAHGRSLTLPGTTLGFRSMNRRTSAP